MRDSLRPHRSVCQRADLPKIPEGGGKCIVGDSSIRVRCCDGCIVSCRRCCTQRTAASAALRIALSVFAVFLPLSLGRRPPLDTLFFLSPSSHYPFRFLADPLCRHWPKPLRSNKSPFPPQVVSRISASSEGDSGRKRRTREDEARVNFQMHFRGERRDEGWRKWIGRGGVGRRAMQRPRSRFIAFREQHRQNLISSSESLISRKLVNRDSAEFAPDRRTDKQTDGRQSEMISPDRAVFIKRDDAEL